MPISPDIFSVHIRAEQFKQERIREKKGLPPGSLERRSPFEIAPFLQGMTRLTQEIGENILKYHLISDDISGRIPTLILLAWQKRAQIAAGITTLPEDKIRADFILGGHKNIQNQSKIEEFIVANLLRLQKKPNLLVTDNIDTGASLKRLLELFDKHQIPVDIAILSHYDRLSEYQELLKNRKVFHGERLPRSFIEFFGNSAGSAVIDRHDTAGLAANPQGTPRAHPILGKMEYRNREMERLVREQAIKFAAMLPLPRLPKVTTDPGSE